MSVEDIDGEGTHIDELSPDRLVDHLMQAESDLGKRARELMHAHTTQKHDAARQLIEQVGEYVALCDRHTQVRWDDWKRVEKLRQVAKNLQELGETSEADRFEAQAEEQARHCFQAAGR